MMAVTPTAVLEDEQQSVTQFPTLENVSGIKFIRECVWCMAHRM